MQRSQYNHIITKGKAMEENKTIENLSRYIISGKTNNEKQSECIWKYLTFKEKEPYWTTTYEDMEYFFSVEEAKSVWEQIFAQYPTLAEGMDLMSVWIRKIVFHKTIPVFGEQANSAKKDTAKEKSIGVSTSVKDEKHTEHIDTNISNTDIDVRGFTEKLIFLFDSVMDNDSKGIHDSLDSLKDLIQKTKSKVASLDSEKKNPETKTSEPSVKQEEQDDFFFDDDEFEGFDLVENTYLDDTIDQSTDVPFIPFPDKEKLIPVTDELIDDETYDKFILFDSSSIIEGKTADDAIAPLNMSEETVSEKTQEDLVEVGKKAEENNKASDEENKNVEEANKDANEGIHNESSISSDVSIIAQVDEPKFEGGSSEDSKHSDTEDDNKEAEKSGSEEAPESEKTADNNSNNNECENIPAEKHDKNGSTEKPLDTASESPSEQSAFIICDGTTEKEEQSETISTVKPSPVQTDEQKHSDELKSTEQPRETEDSVETEEYPAEMEECSVERTSCKTEETLSPSETTVQHSFLEESSLEKIIEENSFSKEESQSAANETNDISDKDETEITPVNNNAQKKDVCEKAAIASMPKTKIDAGNIFSEGSEETTEPPITDNTESPDSQGQKTEKAEELTSDSETLSQQNSTDVSDDEASTNSTSVSTENKKVKKEKTPDSTKTEKQAPNKAKTNQKDNIKKSTSYKKRPERKSKGTEFLSKFKKMVLW